MTTSIAVSSIREFPMMFLALALFAEIKREWIGFEESQQGE
jgi:hypothetical protein